MTIIRTKYRGTAEYAAVRDRLLQAARDKGLVTYKEIAELMHIRTSGSNMGMLVGQMLGEISEDEVTNGGTMLSCLVVRVADKRPGEGFYVFAQQLGLLEDMPDNSERESFLDRQRQQTYAAYGSAGA